MIIGAHSIIYSTDPEADRAFFRDVLGMPNVDVGGGWLIFGLPPAELAVHPSDKNDLHKFYLMCADLDALMEYMSKRKIVCSPVHREQWGLLTDVTLPGVESWGSTNRCMPAHHRWAPPLQTGHD